jgi:hypothetical protein
MQKTANAPKFKTNLKHVWTYGAVLLSGIWAMDAQALQGFTSHGNGEVTSAELASQIPAELLPDLQTVVPLQVQLVRQQQGEFIRFSNGIANAGPARLQMRPEFPGAGTLGPQKAFQQFVDAAGNVVGEALVGEFEFHPAHNHWHIGDVALFEIRVGAPDGPIFGMNSIKTTFCLIDWYALEGNANTKERVFWDCADGLQGLSAGWVDQYHQAIEGQALDITGAPEGDYYLVSTSNPAKRFIESNYDNNVAWVKFKLERKSGNPKIEIIGTSPGATPAMYGVGAPNR